MQILIKYFKYKPRSAMAWGKSKCFIKRKDIVNEYYAQASTSGQCLKKTTRQHTLGLLGAKQAGILWEPLPQTPSCFCESKGGIAALGGEI